MTETIVVLKGGWSSERDVSLRSGAACATALRDSGYAVTEIDVTRDIPALTAALLAAKPACVFMALHGDCGENGKVQAVFDLFGIKYTGTDSFSSALAMDKSITKQLFLQNGVPTPASHLLTGKDDPYKPEFPCVVKVSGGGSSVGVYIVQNEKEYADAVQDAFRYDANTQPHPHVRCTCCGRVDDIMDLTTDSLEAQAASETGYHIEAHQYYFFGVCPSCQGQKKH